MPVRGSCPKDLQFLEILSAKLNKIVEAGMLVDLYGNGRVSLWCPNRKVDLDIVQAS